MMMTESPMTEDLSKQRPFESFRSGQDAEKTGSMPRTAPPTDRQFFESGVGNGQRSSQLQYFENYNPMPPRMTQVQGRDKIPHGSSSKHSLHTLLDRLASDGPDLRLGRKSEKEDRSRQNSNDTIVPIIRSREQSADDRRGGAHRGVKDYPHLPKKAEKSQEQQERAGLVGGSSESDEDSSSKEDSGKGDIGGSGFLGGTGDGGYAGQEVQLGPEYLVPGLPQSATPSPPAFRRLPGLPDLKAKDKGAYPPRSG